VNETTQEEILRYELNQKFEKEDALEFGRLYRAGNSWEFEAMGRAHIGSLEELVRIYT
jgi:tellurium resistance protein TerD